jgi:hypothetical protein
MLLMITSTQPIEIDALMQRRNRHFQLLLYCVNKYYADITRKLHYFERYTSLAKLTN